jgi:hypothetical protein
MPWAQAPPETQATGQRRIGPRLGQAAKLHDVVGPDRKGYVHAAPLGPAQGHRRPFLKPQSQEDGPRIGP